MTWREFHMLVQGFSPQALSSITAAGRHKPDDGAISDPDAIERVFEKYLD